MSIISDTRDLATIPMKKAGKSSRKPDDSLPPYSNESSSINVNVGLHRVSYQVEPDGSAEAVLLSNKTVSPLFAAAPQITRTMSTPLQSSSIPLARTKSIPLGGMSYTTLRRVLSSRDDRGSGQHHQHQDALLEQESEGLVRNVFSRQDDQWQSTSMHTSEADHYFCRGNGTSSLQGGYDLRQVNSTPLQGMENGYALQRAKTTGYEQQQQQQQQLSSLYEEERIHNPILMVRSHLSSIGQKVSGGKDVGTNSKDDNVSNVDDLSFIAESIESPSNPSKIPNYRRKKKRSKYFMYQILFAAMMISAGIAGTSIYLLLKANREDEGGGEVSSVVVMLGREEGEGITSAVEDGTIGSSSVGDDITLKVLEDAPDDYNAVEENDIVVESGDIVKDEDIATVEESNETAADNTSLNSVIDATPQLGSAVSNVINSTVDRVVGEDETMEMITIAANATTDIGDQPIPATTVSATTTTAPSPLSDVVEESNNETAADDISLSGVVDSTPKLESAVSNVINSTVDRVVGEDETIENIAIAANVTADIMDQTIPATTVPATTTRTTPPPQSDTITRFYVMADAPYTDYERYNLMPKHIEELDDTVEFLVHLGDLQWAKVDKCREGAYDEASTIMQKSRIPTFILPGDNDINDCNSMTHGEEMWTKYFATFDKRFDHSLNVTRWGKLNESFSFIHKEVLFLGLNIIGGRPASNSEKRFRHSQHLERIGAILSDQFDDFKVVVLLGHAEPGQYHFDFFGGDDGFISMMKEMGKPTIHFHGDWHAYYEREAEYGVDNYMRISLDGESRAPPILVTIDTSVTNPVKFDRRCQNLEVACCSEGWPRHDGRAVNTPRPN